MMNINLFKKKSRKAVDHIVNIVICLFIGTFAIIFLAPIVLTFTNSFMSASEISSNYGMVFSVNEHGGKTFIANVVNLKLIPDLVSFSQYKTVLFSSPDYLIKFWNSVIFVVPITVFQLFVAAFASYGFSRSKGKIRGLIFFAYIILMLMPYQVTLVPNYIVMDKLNLLNTYWAIWLPGIFSPFAVYLITKYMRKIPSSILEAAQIDGAGELKIFFSVAMPLCKGILFSAAILVFIDYWNMVEQPLILLQDDLKYPLSVYLSRINQEEIGVAFCVAGIYMLPVVLLFLYAQDYLIDGITYQSGVKG